MFFFKFTVILSHKQNDHNWLISYFDLFIGQNFYTEIQMSMSFFIVQTKKIPFLDGTKIVMNVILFRFTLCK